MIDVHCHILPDIDDGAMDLEESMIMARTLAEQGYTGVIATPHCMEVGKYQTTLETIRERVDLMNKAIADEGLDFKVYQGAEYYLDRSLPDLTRLKFPLATMAGTNYILVALPSIHFPPPLA